MADVDSFSQKSYFVCNFCAEKFMSKLSIKRHIFSSHCFDKNFEIICNIGGCTNHLNSVICLRKHVSTHHRGMSWEMPKNWYRELHTGAIEDFNNSAVNASCSTGLIDVVPVPPDLGIPPSSSNLILDSELKHKDINDASLISIQDNDDSDESMEEDNDILTFKNTLKNLDKRENQTSLSLCKLKSDCNLTESSLLVIEQWAEGLLQESINTVIGGIKCRLANDKITPEIQTVFELGRGLANPFANVETEAKRKNMLPCFVVS